jgi:alpha-galactosidase
MALLDKYFGDMYINLSISPIFPAQYAQSRRIACDAWNKMKDTEYTMNAVSYGWWIDRVYSYNDADHVVLNDATEGENRARVTSAVITGLFISGDDFSEGGSAEGKERAKTYLTNQHINALANGISFRPLEGNGEKSENQFIREDETGIYYVYFNYKEEAVEVTVPIDRIAGAGSARPSKAMDLWNNKTIPINNTILVPGKDVLVLKL